MHEVRGDVAAKRDAVNAQRTGTHHFKGVVYPLSRSVLVAWLVGTLTLLVVAPRAQAGHPAGPRGSAKRGAIVAPKQPRAIEGRVMEVRRISRQLTVRTRQGTLEHVTIPREAAVTAPHGERGLSGIRRGMTVRIAHRPGSQGLVAHQVVAQTAQPEGRPAGHRVAH